MKQKTFRRAQLLVGVLIALFLTLQAMGSMAQSKRDSLHTLAKSYYESSIFNGFIRVEKEGQLLLNRAYGLADYSRSMPFSESSRFRLGSLSKQFTAFIIVRLATEHRLDLSDTLGKYFPDYQVGARVTVNQLLSHSGGIPNFTDFENYDSLKACEIANDNWLLEKLKKMPLDFEPGTNFNYSNSGYMLLAIIAEKATGRAWANLTKKYITNPNRLGNTGVERNRLRDKIIPGYDEDLSKLSVVADDINPAIAKGSGNNFTSVADFSKWLNHIMNQKENKNSWKQELFIAEAGNYAKGWEVFTSGKHNAKVIYHSGGIDGFRSSVIMIPAFDIKIIVLSNHESGIVSRQLPFQLLDIVMGVPVNYPAVRKIQPIPPNIEEYEGEYLLNEKLGIKIEFSDDHLEIQFSGQPAVRLYSYGNDRFLTIAADASFYFHRNAAGRIASFDFCQGTTKLKAVKKE